MPCQWENDNLPSDFRGTRFLENLCLDCLHMFNHNTKKFHHLDPLGSVHNTTRIVRMAPPSPIGGSCCQEIPSWASHDTRLAGLTRRCSIEDHGMLRWFPCDAGACCADCSSMLGGRHGFKVSCVLGGKMIENGFMDSISSELFSHFDVFVPCPLPSNIGRELFTTARTYWDGRVHHFARVGPWQARNCCATVPTLKECRSRENSKHIQAAPIVL